MTNGDLSSYSRAKLASAGWFPERCVDVSIWSLYLSGKGCLVHERARAFLAEFGGLRIPVDRSSDLDTNVASYPFDRISMFLASHYLREPVCLIGEWDGNELELIMLESGKVVGIYHGTDYCWIGESGEDAINNIMRRRPVEYINYDDLAPIEEIDRERLQAEEASD
jgi:hypothetical protein